MNAKLTFVRRSRPSCAAVAAAALGFLLSASPAPAQDGGASDSAGLPALAREYVTTRQRLLKLDEKMDIAQAELRRMRGQVRRELENSPEIERARLDLQDARHDYYAARDRVMTSLKDNREYVAAKEQVREVSRQIDALRLRMEAELAQTDAAELAADRTGPAPAQGQAQPPAPARGAVTGQGAAGGTGTDGTTEAGGAGDGGAAESEAPGSVQDRVFELARQKLRIADKAASIEAEALRADPQFQKVWDAYVTASGRVSELESQVDRKLAQHEGLAEARERLDELQEEYEMLEADLAGIRAAHRAATEQQAREEDARRREGISGEEWYWWSRAHRANRR